jgi:EAL domain-containing protein (putative c-di-GMP-specific phosphodiesterase class I)
LYDYLFNVGSAGPLPSILLLRFSFSGQVKTLAGSMRPALLSTIETVLKEVFPGDQWVFNKDDFSVAVFDCEGGSGELNIDSKAKLKSLQSRIARLFLRSAPEHQLAVFAPLVAAIFVDKSILASHRGSERSAVVERLESIVEGAKSGKGKVFLYTDDSIKLPSLRLDMPSLINRAVQANSPEFSIAWQPQINLTDGSIHGAEALARWNSPELGFVSPEKFISTSEDWGLIDKLGTLLRDIAMKEFLAMQSLEVALPRMSFNVSPFELLDPTFGEDLLEHVRSHEIPFEVVTAEITESASVLESKDGLNNLRLLKDSGMGLAVDDFGSGFTSLGALSEQPLTELKIDRSYLEGIGDNPKLLAVVSNMVSLAEDIEAISVVEGIEDKEQLEILRALGCNYGQGYYWSKPIPMADLGVLLQSADPFPK